MTGMCFYKHIGKSIYYKTVQASIHISVGLSALLGFKLSGAMRRPLHRGTGHRAGSTFEPELYFVGIDYQHVTGSRLMH